MGNKPQSRGNHQQQRTDNDHHVNQFPPSYFELDGDVNKIEEPRGEEGKLEVTGLGYGCSMGAHGIDNYNITVNQSTTDVIPVSYDHLMETPRNNHHKYV